MKIARRSNHENLNLAGQKEVGIRSTTVASQRKFNNINVTNTTLSRIVSTNMWNEEEVENTEVCIKATQLLYIE